MSHGSMAEKKLNNMTAYMQLFPEYQYVWAGDSGQVRRRGHADAHTSAPLPISSK